MTTHTPDWAKDAIFYQIFPDRFAKSEHVAKPSNLQPWGAKPTFNGFMGGDLLGVVEKLDHLVDLGVNAIYFNPIFSSASNHRYHTYDYFEIDPILGGNEAFAEMLDAAHERGIRVLLDGVFNHASRGFFQFNHLMECGHESPYVDWFHIKGWPVNAFAAEAPNYAAWWGIPALPKFNTDTPAVREYLWRVGEYWLEMGIDGWRLDVPNEIDDDEFWREFRRRCLAVNPDCYIVGELWHDAHRWLQGDQFDAQMNYNFTRATLGFFIGDNMDQSDTHRTGYGHMATLNGHQFLNELDRINNHLYNQEIVLAQMNMLGSHDTPRVMTIASNDIQGVKLMYLNQMTSPGAPNVYYGDEIGLTGGHDPDCRNAFPWNSAETWNASLLDSLKSYIALRNSCDALRRGSFVSLYADHDVVAYGRVHENDYVLTIFNRSQNERTVSIEWADAPTQWHGELEDAGVTIELANEIVLEGRSGRVFIGRK